MSYEFCSTVYDEDFRKANGLTWLPWVGRNFHSRQDESKLLIVGESHYVRPKEGESLKEVIKDHIMDHNYTRDVVWECLIHQEWPNRTLDTLPKLLFGTGEIDRERFWSDTAFYNFIQSPMHYNREGSPERPSWDAFVAGWNTFLKVIHILRPSHCLFIGVEAFNSFNHAMNEIGAIHEQVQWTEKVSNTYGRRASLTEASDPLTLAGVQHLGKYFSWSRWADYLQRIHPDLMGFLGAGRYTEINKPNKAG